MAMTAILPVPDAGSTAVNESSCCASRLLRGALWPGVSSGVRYGGIVIGGPGLTGSALFSAAGTSTVVFRYIA
jgi:hypothetical protein